MLLLEKIVLLNLGSKSIMPKNLHQFYVWNLKGEPKCSNEKVMPEIITKSPKLLKSLLMKLHQNSKIFKIISTLQLYIS